ncbi:MAG TPA: phosphate signaling complex protein PhoU [Candidatus Cloacimonadota bacterium]|nr:phosphate signaling complex protein PhoU [Candidatus Cloacimonadota bacterium]
MQEHKLKELKGLLMSEASLVEKMISLTINGIYDVGSSFWDEVMTFEQRVNQIELELENKCTTAIALHQPEAKDLRLILMIYKINNDLERLGDQAVNIAESAKHLIGDPVLQELPELKEMTSASMAMLQNSLNAFVNEDVEASQEVCNADNIVDDFNRSIYKHAVVLMKENPQRIDSYMHLLRIARNLERIGDLSTNIAENTIYLSAGRVIKHHLEDEPASNADA